VELFIKIIILFFLFNILLFSYGDYEVLNGRNSNLKLSNFFISLKLNNSISKPELKKELSLIKYLPMIQEIKKISEDSFVIKFTKEIQDDSYVLLKDKYDILESYVLNNDSWPLVVTNRINIKFKKNIDSKIKNKIFSDYELKILKKHTLSNSYTVSVNKNVFMFSNKLFETGFFEYSYPDFYILFKKKFVPDDTYYSKQWHHQNEVYGIASEGAWDINKGSESIKIVILDDGVDLNHEDLNIIAYKDFTNKGFNDMGSHGTACAGIVAARSNNNTGVTGVCMNCSLLVAKVMPLSGYNLESMMVNAFNWSYEQSSDIYNNSWGFDENIDIKKYYPMLFDTINSIIKNSRAGKGGIVVFASGNENREFSDKSLEGMKGIITVGAIDYHGSRAYYSNYGDMLDFVAPSSTGYLGSDLDAIWTTDITGKPGYNDNGSAYQDTSNGREYLGDDIDESGNYTKYFGGTSASAPIVSGLIGLMLSENENLTLNQIYDVLKLTSDKIGSGYDENGHSDYLGYGKINATKALEYVSNNINLCDNVNCTGHGVCIEIDNTMVCNCYTGYHNENLECIKDKEISLCDNISCSNHGECIINNEKAICECNDGYINSGDTTCVVEEADLGSGSDSNCSLGNKNKNILFIFVLFLFILQYRKYLNRNI